TAGLSSLVGTDPVIAQQMMQGFDMGPPCAAFGVAAANFLRRCGREVKTHTCWIPAPGPAMRGV
ncbi:MAG: hypothetical protein AAFP68_15665, partial [Pseudomonadota bacterium]